MASVQAATPPIVASTIRIGGAPSMRIALAVSERIAVNAPTGASASAAGLAADAVEPERAGGQGKGHA
jgi:hypothetical protein